MNELNPYRAPVAGPVPARSREPASTGPSFLTFSVLWLLVFGVNQIFPMIASWTLAEGYGSAGIVAGQLFLVACGLGFGYRFTQHRNALNVGGVILALCQLFPVIHLFAGLIGLEFSEAIFSTDHNGADFVEGVATDIYSIRSFGHGLVCTILTGGVLAAVAIAIGMLVMLMIKSLKISNGN